MANSILPVPQRTQTVGAYKGPKTSLPTIIINNTKPVRSAYRYATRHPDRIEIGGGLVPSIKCSRNDLGVCVLAVGFAVGVRARHTLLPQPHPRRHQRVAGLTPGRLICNHLNAAIDILLG